MSDTIKRIKKVEYKNCTDNEIIWVEQGNTPTRAGVPIGVKPGASVFLTEDDIIIQKYERKDQRFLDGRLREANSPEAMIPSQIRVRDDMSSEEIVIVVKNLKSAQELANKLKSLSSIATVTAFMDECEKQDRQVSFMKTCLRKLNALSGQMEIKLKNLVKESKKEETKND